jgi:hypothetical protein
LRDVFGEIDTIIREHLKHEERNLFLRILASPEPTVRELLPQFVRNDSDEHKWLRALRGVYFIRPRGGGRWELDSVIEVTTLGRLVQKHKAEALGA